MQFCEGSILPGTLSNCFSPEWPRNTSPPGHQSQVTMEYTPYGLHMPTDFSKAMGEHRARACLPVLAGQLESSVLYVPTGSSKVEGE